MPHWVVEAVPLAMVTATGRWPGQRASSPVSGSAGGAASGALSAGRTAQPASRAAQSARLPIIFSAVKIRFMAFPRNYW